MEFLRVLVRRPVVWGYRLPCPLGLIAFIVLVGFAIGSGDPVVSLGAAALAIGPVLGRSWWKGIGLFGPFYVLVGGLLILRAFLLAIR